MVESTSTSLTVTHLPEEKQQPPDACNVTLEKQIKELKAKMTELEATLYRKTKATVAAPKQDNTEAQYYASCQ
jgi:hypothetical protein